MKIGKGLLSHTSFDYYDDLLACAKDKSAVVQTTTWSAKRNGTPISDIRKGDLGHLLRHCYSFGADLMTRDCEMGGVHLAQ